jgi:hypothetical protein
MEHEQVVVPDFVIVRSRHEESMKAGENRTRLGGSVLAPCRQRKDIDYAHVHESRSRRVPDARELRLRPSPDRSPAVAAGKRQQSRPDHGHEQRHRPRQDREDVRGSHGAHTIAAKRGGDIFTQIQSVFPNQKPIDRTFINARQDHRVVEAVKTPGARNS